MNLARVDAIVTWAYAAGFGLPTIPIAVYHLRTAGRLPTFFGMFEMYGGRWSARYEPGAFAALLMGFLLVAAAVAFSGWLLWQGFRAGAVLNLALLPAEAVFWIGFDLPIPWVLGAARVVLALLAWSSLSPRGAAL
ncbi:hypothetical protein ACFPER_03215 [Agromyces aurantiacus]|uniref:DUF4345 domain-containing protein n=1 Tax=Agromyces aurantiacus TaxID=165814 RepID=A0ABV9R1T9_9MICO|nr:hypothetical protein [Agromyces aurantiacus]MBM7506102.1 hypothetical protein [Agromyces aurantiacus]